MGKFVEVSKIGEVGEGAMKTVNPGGREILLAKVGDKYYAADSRCPHMGGKLSQGKLEGTVVTCPLHGSQFDPSNGQVVRWSEGTVLTSKLGVVLKKPKPLTTYKVKVEEDKILIEI